MCESHQMEPANSSHSCERPSRSQRTNSGFTLIEIMAVVIIMGLLMGMVGVGVFAQVDKAKATTAKGKIAQLESALEFYRMDNSKYPPSLDGLMNKTDGARNFPKGGYLRKKEALLDPWEQMFQYTNPGAKNPYSVDLSSAGPDGVLGNEDDINNWSSTAGE
jgi:general secretion pathway protein G